MRRTLQWLMLAMAVCCYADDRPALPIASGEWSPYITTDNPRNSLLGDLIERVGARMGMRIEWHMLSWPLVEHMVQEGKVFAGLPYVKTPERLAQYDFSAPLLESRTVLFYLTSNPLAKNLPGSWADLARHRIAGPHGYWWEAEITRYGGQILFSGDEVSAFKVLAAGRADFVPQEELVGFSMVQTQLPNLRGRIATIAIADSPGEKLHLILSRSYPDKRDLRARFAAALDEELKSGRLAEAVARYTQSTKLSTP